MIATEVLEGEKVRLRPIEESDLPLFVRWLNDPDVRHWQHRSERGEETLESQRARQEHNLNDPAHVGWCIETASGKPIGNLGLEGIDETHGRAGLYVFIGEKEYWGRGYGADAVRCVLRHAFGDLGLRRVWLITDEDNARGIRCYEKCGFAREGLLRAHRLRHGQPIDMLIMGALKEEVGG